MDLHSTMAIMEYAGKRQSRRYRERERETDNKREEEDVLIGRLATHIHAPCSARYHAVRRT